MPMSLLYSRSPTLSPELAVCSPAGISGALTRFSDIFSLFSFTTPTSKKDKNKQYYHFAPSVSCSISHPGLCCQCRYVDIHITNNEYVAMSLVRTRLNRSTNCKQSPTEDFFKKPHHSNVQCSYINQI